jgi:hypothetical protein
MVLIEPTDVSLVEMISDCDDSFAFELGWLPGMDEVTRSIAALLTLAGKICADLFRHDLRKNFGWVDRWVLEVKHTQILPLLGGCINLHVSLRLLLLLMIGRIGIVGRIKRSGGVALVSLTLFRTRLGIGSRFASQWPATGLSVIPRTDVVGRNNILRNDNGEHGDLVEIDLITKCLHNRSCSHQSLCIELGNRTRLGHNIPISKISCKIRKAVENTLQEDVAIPMQIRHRTNALRPTYSFQIVDD